MTRKSSGVWLLAIVVLLLFSGVRETQAVSVGNHNHCENLSEWALSGGDGYANLTLSYIAREGNHSLEFVYAEPPPYWHSINLQPVTPVTWNSTFNVWGFWVYFNPRNEIGGFLEGVNYYLYDPTLYGSYRNIVMLTFLHISTSQMSYVLTVLEGATHLTWTGTTQYISLQNWYWFEIGVNATSPYVTLMVNGDLKESDTVRPCALANDITYTFINNDNLNNMTRHKMDYWRMASGFGMPSGYFDDLSAPNLDAGNWVFANWKFYTFNITTVLPADTGATAWDFLRFSFLDMALHNITVFYDVDNNAFTVWNESEFEHERYIRIKQLDNPLIQDPNDPEIFYCDFEIWFTENIVDTYQELVDVYLWGNYSGGTGVPTTFQDVFYIYNRGGFSLNYARSSSNAYRIAGGDVFEFYAQSNASASGIEWVYADYLWRNLQHIKELFQIQARVAYPGFTLAYGMDYYTKADGWIHGWELDLSAINITVPRVSGSEAYWCWLAAWYFNDTFIKNEYIFTFPQGNPANDGDYASSRIWLDFWFNSMNGSSTWGGRVNSYYYPVKDNADAWLRVLSTNWGADDKRQKESLCFGTLKHDDGSTCQTQEIIFARTWSKVTVSNHLTLIQKITQFFADVQDLTLGKIPLIGIQTPSFDETKMPALQSGGFLGALFSGFQWVGKWLADNIVWGGLNLWGNFVGFLDTIAAMLGSPGFFTNLFTRIGEGIDYMAQGFTFAFQILVQIFILISSLLGAFVSVLTDLISSLVNTITTFQDLMSGAIGGAGNLWNDLGISSWLTVALIFYPLYLIFLWEDQGMEPVLQQLGWIFGIASWLFTFFIQIIQFVIGMITSIIESIPIAE